MLGANGLAEVSPRSPTSSSRRLLNAARFTPKLVTCLREGYGARAFVRDLTAGLTVAIIALPLAMALGIASIPMGVAESLKADYPWLSPPAMGLYTAVVAGFLISFLGGSRVQIGGPTAAFIPIVAGVAAMHGYEGLATATLMAGVIVIILGLCGLGAMIKFIPYPVTTGFTAGIAVVIVASQLKDFFGLTITDAEGRPIGLPADFVPKVRLLAEHAASMNWNSAVIGGVSLAILIVLRKRLPRVPGAIVAVVVATLLVRLLGWDRAAGGSVETIGSVFGELPRTLPRPHLPKFSLELVRELIPAATTIAVLCAIESLLSAVVADGMTEGKHRSDQELVAQGLANVGSVFFFGLPATGAIARTVANIKNGGKTPVAGLLHAGFILAFMLLLAPLAKLIPLAALAAVLLMVAWNISEVDRFRTLMRAPKSDVAVLLTTFGLTVFTDLTIAVGVGMVLASMLFMRRMAEVTNVSAITRDLREEVDERLAIQKDPNTVTKRDVPPGVEVYEINGPFFFGVADRLMDTLRGLERPPRVFILRMRKVPAIDATGLHALEEFHGKCRRDGIRLILSGVHAQPLFAFVEAGFDRVVGLENLTENIDDALALARAHVHVPPVEKPRTAIAEVAREAEAGHVAAAGSSGARADAGPGAGSDRS